MSKYEQERIDARRILLAQLLEIDAITDDEIDHSKNDNTAISLTLLRLSKMTKAERAFAANSEGQTNAANADKFLYGEDGMPK
ncbi:hypothetical protein [Kordiimonas lacus]|uniref:Uncharacterized protein n=2 Tax=Kordiimonas lacus TaxID=637679 RepID=A0A1G7F5X6_9PROT|nr:hypothetical protein [Kordiimonas lacus]SDE71292.1 hypothetical protein SAMN04488071_3633 [Kordiimonas lacus]